MLTSLAKVTAGLITMPLFAGVVLAAVAGLIGIRWPRQGRRLLIAGVIGATAFATSLVGDALLRPLESRYPPDEGRLAAVPGSSVVVLGSGFRPHDNVPITAALDQDGLVRIVEGVRLARAGGGRQLLVSGGAAPGQPTPAEGYAELARDLGIADAHIVVVARPRDTASEAREVASLLGQQPFILVTSAYHMPRAMLLMSRAGARPIPAPTGQLTGGASDEWWRKCLPSASGLGKSERALHEYLGLAAVELGLE